MSFMLTPEEREEMNARVQHREQLKDVARNIYKTLDGLTFWDTDTVIGLVQELLHKAKNNGAIKSTNVPDFR